MSRRNKTALLSMVLILTMLGCGLENIQVAESPNLEATISAQAQLLQQSGQASTPSAAVAENSAEADMANSPAPAAIDQPAVGVSTTATETSAPTTVTVTVSAETNCRKGPGTSYISVYSLPVGLAAEVVFFSKARRSGADL